MTTEVSGRPLVTRENVCPIDFTDLPPELVRYRDEGCDMASACLECPFPRCLEEDARAKARHLRHLRDTEISSAFECGHRGIEELAVMFGVSNLTIRRVLNRSGLSPPGKARKGRRMVVAEEKMGLKRHASRPPWVRRLSRALRRYRSRQRREK